MTVNQIIPLVQAHIPTLLGAGHTYAVLVPLVEWAGETCLLFEVRAESLRRQPGEVCFPGGRMEPDETPTDCALRETWEELGIPLTAVTVVAPLDFLCHQSGFLMHPILGVVEPQAVAQLTPGPGEVKETFLVPLSFFLNTPPLRPTYQLVPDVPNDFPYDLIGFPGGYPWRRGEVEVPIYRWQDKAIWGLTARIVHHLVERLR